MSMDGFNGELWNEFQWEAHLNEVEKKSEQLRRFIESDLKGNTPRWITLLKESLSEDDAFEAYVEEELLMDEAYFPEDEDDWEDEEEYDDEDFLFGFDEFDEFPDADEDDFDAGEEWKSLSEDFALSDNGSLDNLGLFRDARFYAVDILKWAESVPAKSQDKIFLEFVGDSLKIAAKLAGGYSFGFEQEFLGANIAYTKKALRFANQSLEMMGKLKTKSCFTRQSYAEFNSRLFELRNDIGVYIQDLRDRFNNSID
ncbi:MAG TPA: hypothetical protein DF712_09860 [Balneola sp.]|nr:hypothetical protein [Bacteroidota bacterium]HCT52753.1 hypothetical protein [Balneola sp.]